MKRMLSFFGLFNTSSNKRQKTDAIRSDENSHAAQKRPRFDPPKGPSRTGTRPYKRKTRQERLETLDLQQTSYYIHWPDKAKDPGITTLATQLPSSSRDVLSLQGAPTLKRRASTSWQDSPLRSGEMPGGLQQSNQPPNPYVGQGTYLLDNLQLAINANGPSTNHASPSPLVPASRSVQSTSPSSAEGSFHVALLAIEQLTGHTFHQPGLLREALYIGARPIEIDGRLITESNKRLALVGDRALAMVWWDAWFYREESRGTGSDRFQDASTNNALALSGWKHGLNKFVVGEDGLGGTWMSVKRMADTVDAIIGAVWLDSLRDTNAVKTALIGLLGAEKVDSVLRRASADYSPYH